MTLLEPTDYYADRDVEHSAQGDIHLDVPFFVGTVANGEEPPRGARKRPEVAIRPPLRESSAATPAASPLSRPARPAIRMRFGSSLRSWA